MVESLENRSRHLCLSYNNTPSLQRLPFSETCHTIVSKAFNDKTKSVDILVDKTESVDIFVECLLSFSVYKFT